MNYDFSGLGSGWGSPAVPLGTDAYQPNYLDPAGMSAAVPQNANAFGMDGLGQSLTGADAGAGGGGFFDSLGGFLKGALGTKDNPGWGSGVASLGQGLMGAWMGMQQYGLAKQKLAESKRQFDLNYAANKQMTNSQLEDRQRARVASNPGAYQSVGDYMGTNGIK